MGGTGIGDWGDRRVAVERVIRMRRGPVGVVGDVVVSFDEGRLRRDETRREERDGWMEIRRGGP